MRRIEPTGPIEMRLVLNVEPFHWSDRRTPDGPAEERRKNWLAYFRECMSDAGIVGIEPIRSSLWFVDAFAVVDNELMLRMIREVFEGSGLPGFPNEDGREDISDTDPLASLEGGYAIFGEDELLLEPGCCCGFADLDDWKQALLEQPENTDLWLGHPQTEISFVGEVVTVREGHEPYEGGPPPPDSLVEFSISVNELGEAVKRAEEARRRFTERLLPRVRELVADPSLATKVTGWLMGEG